ncbi:hypothetical protein CYK57_00345 [Actinobacillus pleuropneumoniae]|nr:hypothetical protein CYK57_00345 [Actinobacillus pleuropneumoniae]
MANNTAKLSKLQILCKNRPLTSISKRKMPALYRHFKERREN